MLSTAREFPNLAVNVKVYFTLQGHGQGQNQVCFKVTNITTKSIES